MTLDRIKCGQRVSISSINDPRTRMLALRFGLTEGSSIVCDQVIPTGAIIVRRNRQQLAVGRDMASVIEVIPIA